MDSTLTTILRFLRSVWSRTTPLDIAGGEQRRSVAIPPPTYPVVPVDWLILTVEATPVTIMRQHPATKPYSTPTAMADHCRETWSLLVFSVPPPLQLRLTGTQTLIVDRRMHHLRIPWQIAQMVRKIATCLRRTRQFNFTRTTHFTVKHNNSTGRTGKVRSGTANNPSYGMCKHGATRG